MRLLHHLQSLARRMRPARPVLIGVGGLAFALAAYLIVFADPQSGETLLYGAIVLFLWCLCAVLLVNTFQTVPPPLSPDQGFWSRLKRRTARLWYGLLALVFIGLTVQALSMTKSILGEALG